MTIIAPADVTAAIVRLERLIDSWAGVFACDRKDRMMTDRYWLTCTVCGADYAVPTPRPRVSLCEHCRIARRRAAEKGARAKAARA